MCGKDCPCQQSGFRVRRNARMGYAAGCATEPETFTNHQFEFKAEPFELALPGEWEMENEGDEFEGDLYSEMEDEARRRRGRATPRVRGRSLRPRIKTRRRKPARKFPKWPFRFPVAGGLGALLAGLPPIEKPPAQDNPSVGGTAPTSQPSPDSEPPYAAEPDSEPPYSSEPADDSEPPSGSEPEPSTAEPEYEYMPQTRLAGGNMNNPFTFEIQPTQPFAPSFLAGENEYEATACKPFTPVAVENPKRRRKDGRISDKTIPSSADLITIQGAFGKTTLHRLAAVALEALVCAARADGIKHPQLLPTGSLSGFRTPKQQASLRSSSEAKHGSQNIGKWVAKPGSSAHQTGRAIDFYLGIPNGRRNVARLRQTPAYKWMVANAHRFGFYPYKDEPWHWEYNPSAAGQSEMFYAINESSDFESAFADEYEAFEDGFSGETEEWEYETALDVLSPSELKAVKITSTFETGRAGGFGGLTGNFDGQGLSFGLLNFTVKAGSLIPLLQEFINKHPQRYAAAFGKDADRFKETVFATMPDPKNPRRRIRDVARQMQFVNGQMNAIPQKAKSNKIIEPWKTYFGRLENDSEFRKIQVKAVRRALDRARSWFKEFGFKTERGFVFMFDLVSSHGGAWLNAPKFKGKRKALLQQMLAAKQAQLGGNALTESQKMEVIANMIADVSLPEWREKARVRKLWFVRGVGKVHGRLFDIRKDFGVTDSAPDFGNGKSPELEWEAYYGNDEQETGQPVAAPAPKLLDSEKASHGETIYLQIGLGRGRNPAGTGIYVPNSFKPESGVTVIVYLHGHKGKYPGNAATIKTYWDGARFPFFALREEVSASGQNVIFVAPPLGPKSEPGSLIEPGGFDAFMQQVLAGFNQHYLMPRHGRRISEVRSIILAAHSGGGSPMLSIAKGKDQYARKIKECWGFDSMYGLVAPSWIAWAKSHPQQSFYAYYGPGKGPIDPITKKKRYLPQDNAEALACELRKQKLANVCVQPSAARNMGKASAHFGVPKAHIKERLINSPCKTGNICPKRRV
ncbi:MAG: D-alanyl-D-alanine carboxypeptidase family protein [Blastocatellia bacterium]